MSPATVACENRRGEKSRNGRLGRVAALVLFERIIL